MNWLHFVGKAYYTPETFRREAESLGISRRVSLRNLGGFQWGDRVFLAFGDFRTRRRKTPVTPSRVIGYFDVSTVGGLPQKVVGDLPKEAFDSFEELNPPPLISRGCGGYRLIGRVDGLQMSIRDLAEFLRDGDYPDLKPTVGGEFVPIDPPVEIGVSFHFGFMRVPLDAESLEARGLEGLILYLKSAGPQVLKDCKGEIIDDYQLNFWDRTGF